MPETSEATLSAFDAALDAEKAMGIAGEAPELDGTTWEGRLAVVRTTLEISARGAPGGAAELGAPEDFPTHAADRQLQNIEQPLEGSRQGDHRRCFEFLEG
mmetsp:Transcript_93676/g.303288  ORF Transcript_93676/g.303288 Transcript_93676/m.303288 type:complete len:101 (+) Transcript_93676:1233-1535(+)